MGEIGKVPNYQVKVDNWSIFFLQRLHHFYKKDYHCDLTLVFKNVNTVKSIKVHRLVLHACTDYFESLEVTKDSEHGECLQLSDEMHPDVVIPIISFMYTGKLEFPASLQTRLYEAASKFRMTILTKLLDAQLKQSVQAAASTQSDDTFQKPTGFQCNVADENSQSADVNQVCHDAQTHAVQVLQIMSNMPVPSPSKQAEDSVVTVAAAPTVAASVKTPTRLDATPVSRNTTFDALKSSNNNAIFKTKVFRKEGTSSTPETTPKTKIVDLSLPPTLPGRKLPIWKRKVPFTGSAVVPENTSDVLSTDRSFSEPPKPTRFEWDEDLNDPTVLRPVQDAFRALAHDVPTEIRHPIILDGDVTSSRSKDASNLNDIAKRGSPGSPESPDSPPFKRSKADLQDMKEYGKQQQLRNEILCSEENSEDGMDPDDLYGSCDDESQDMSSSFQSSVNSSTPKPILKSLPKPEPSQPASKRVRFSLEGKENNKKPNDFAVTAKKPGTVFTKQKIVLPMNVNKIRTGGHHVKIVSEVLKKYPNLTKRDNVKLKVVSKIPAAVPPTVQHAVEGDAGSGTKSTASHVSYIYLMNENPNQVSNIQMVTSDKDKEFDVENRTGPWICHSCDPSNPIEFDSYFTYRRHLVEIHEMKIDARICEHCGLRSSKRNHLLYHLYTKHNIDPPANVSFPKCSECDYIALSDALLLKHRSVHETKELLTCYVCNVVFRSLASMQSHLNTDYHIQRASVREGKQIYRCPYCEALFADGDKLGKHIVTTHWGKNNQSSNQGASEDVLDKSGQELQYSEESTQESQLDSSETPQSQESSDLEPLNKVASGIVTSLNLVGSESTVVYYEQHPGHQDIGGEATVMTGEDCKDFIIPGSVEEVDPGSEYHRAEQSDDTVSVDNEDSNSRTSNIGEVHPTSCSDHDYSEPQSDDGLRQGISIQQVSSDNYQGTTQFIQQIIPDQQLVLTSQPSVLQVPVFQSSRLNMPQRMVLAPGSMVLSSGQNVILPQVIPQARIILSNQIIQQPANILGESGGTLLFTNSQVSGQDIENVEALTYGGVESVEAEGGEAEKDAGEDGKGDVIVAEETSGGDINGAAVEEAEDNQMESVAGVCLKEDTEERGSAGPCIAEPTEADRPMELNEMIEREEGSGGGRGEETAVAAMAVECKKEDVQGEMTASILSNRMSQRALVPRAAETAKIVDEWDETKESPQSVESRSDGPSRPDFF